VFPHHECEIAQSYGAHGDEVPALDGGAPVKSFARLWLHCRHLLVNGRKMSKRDGTFFTVRELLDPRAAGRPELAETLTEAGFATGRVSAPVLRWALVSVPYGQPMSFGTDLLVQARANVERVQSRWDRLVEIAAGPPGSPTDEVETIVATAEAAFDAALDDDLNTPRAIAAVLALVGALNQREAALSGADAARALSALGGFDDVLGGLDRAARTGLVPTAVLEGEPPPEADAGEHISETGIVRLLVARQAARAARDFARADAVREELRTRGVVIEDTPQGVRWKRS